MIHYYDYPEHGLRVGIQDGIGNIMGHELEQQIAALPQWRREVALRYKYEGGKRESALAFRLLQYMLRDIPTYTDNDVSGLQFVIGEHGKPSLAHHPDVHFNLSHCRCAVACAVADRAVGIDIERIGRYNHNVAAYCMSPEELRWIEAEDTELRFTTLWTKKEALVKLLGTGITDNLKTILAEHPEVTCHAVQTDEYVCTIVT